VPFHFKIREPQSERREDGILVDEALKNAHQEAMERRENFKRQFFIDRENRKKSRKWKAPGANETITIPAYLIDIGEQYQLEYWVYPETRD